MATFFEAFAAMEQGKLVRQAHWPDTVWAAIDGERVLFASLRPTAYTDWASYKADTTNPVYWYQGSPLTDRMFSVFDVRSQSWEIHA